MPGGTKILIAGYYGFGNVGDEAILSAMLADLRGRRADLECTVVSGNLSETSGTYDVSSVHWQDIDGLLEAARESDLIILGGGGLFQDYWGVREGTSLTPFHTGISFYSAIGMLAVLYQKPFMIYSVGVGPVTSEEGRRLTRWTFDRAHVCTVRDQESRDLLLSLGIPEDRVHLTADPALNLSFDASSALDILQAQDIDPATTPLLGVCVRSWAEGEAAERWKDEAAAALDRFLEVHGARALFIPFQILERRLENDRSAALDIVARMQNQERVSVLPEPDSPAVMSGLISHCRLIVGMRLHSLIFAASTGVHAVALAYDPKVSSFMRSLGRAEYALDLASLTRGQLFRALETSWLEGAQTRPALDGHVQKLRDLAHETSDMALALLDSRPNLPFSFEVMQDLAIQQARALAGKEKELQTLQAQTAAKEYELQTLKSQWNEASQSRSWKLVQIIGRARNSLLPAGSHRARLARTVYRSSKKLFAAVAGSASPSIREQVSHDALTQLQPHEFSADLQNILDRYAGASGVVIFPPTIGWNISLIQRPHQLARMFAKKGFLVFFCTEYSADDANGFRQVGERLYLAGGPWTAFGLVERPITFTLPYNREFLSYLREPRVVYEVIDDLDVFPGDKALLQKDHAWLLKEADVVLVTADRLMEQVRRIRPDAILSPNAVELEHFSQARSPISRSMPADLAPIIKPDRPVIGYYGALARWFDYELLRHAAQSHPEWDFLLIGPNHDNSLPASDLLSMQNVHWLGPREYAVLPDYLRYFQVATIPFLVNNITLATSPIKLFEYMAAGKPIVTTDLPECRKYPGVLVARSTKEFTDHLEHALTLVDDPVYLEKLSQTAQANTWEARVDQIIQVLEESRSK